MSIAVIALILISTLVTAFISGIFGMAGGLVLMGVLAAVTTVPQAMIIHGAIQFVSNGWRAFLLREHINWRLIGRYSVGAVIAVACLGFVAWVPDKRTLYLILGLMPMLIWLPKNIFHADILRKPDAILSGFLVSGLNTIAGVAGPMLDIFFVRSELTRKGIVANKSTTQALAHLIKVGFWTGPAIKATGLAALPPWWLLVAAIPFSMIGTWLGGLVLHHMNDVNFKRWMKWLVTAIGGVFLLRATGIF